MPVVAALRLTADFACRSQPATIASVVGPVLALIRNLKKLIAGLMSVCSCGGMGATVATVGAANYMGEPPALLFLLLA